MKRKLSLVLAFGASVALVAPDTAGAAPVIGCGSVVKKSVTLQADLLDCPGDGLVVGAAGITIDLNGHAVLSAAVDSSAIPVTPGSAGIRNAGFPRVRISDSTSVDTLPGGNGWIAGFASSVLITDASKASVINITAYDGVRLERTTSATVRQNELEYLSHDCGPLTGVAGLYLVDSTGAAVRGNSVQLGGLGMVLLRSHNNTLQGNAVNPSGSDGSLCSGIVLVDADRNKLTKNVTSQNQGDGIFIDAASQLNVIDGNYAAFNFDDGIDIENATTTVLNTNSVRNRDLGIESVPGVTATGNTAKANGNPLQCLNVVCT